MNRKAVIAIILLVLSAVALPVALYLVQQQQQLKSKAAPATTLRFSPSPATASIGQPVTIDLLMDTGVNQVTAAELSIGFDTAFFQGTPAIVGGSALPVVLVQGQVSGATATITVGANAGSPAQGTSLQIARLTFIPGKEGSSQITFGPATRIAGIAEGSNVLSGSPPPGTITVSAGTTPTATPVPGTPTPTGNVGIGGSAPTATPTITLTPTPTGPCKDTKPAGPPTITGVTTGTNSVTLIWTPARDPVTNYSLTYGLAPGEERFGATNIGDKNIRSFTVSQLSGNTTYYFRIRGVNGCAQGDPSNEVNATPPGGSVTGLPPGFVPLSQVNTLPTPTTFIGGGPSPTPVGGGLAPGGQKPGNFIPTTIFVGIGTLLLLIGGALLLL